MWRLVPCDAPGARAGAARCTRVAADGPGLLLGCLEGSRLRVKRAKCPCLHLPGTRAGPGPDPAGTRAHGLRAHLQLPNGSSGRSRAPLCFTGRFLTRKPAATGRGSGRGRPQGPLAAPSDRPLAPLWARVRAGSCPGPAWVSPGSRLGPAGVPPGSRAGSGYTHQNVPEVPAVRFALVQSDTRARPCAVRARCVRPILHAGAFAGSRVTRSEIHCIFLCARLTPSRSPGC